MQKVFFILIILFFTSQVIAQTKKDTTWLGKQHGFGFIVENNKEDAKYYSVNESPIKINQYYLDHEKLSVTHYDTINEKVYTTYFNKLGQIIFKEIFTKDNFKKFYNNNVVAFSMPSTYQNYKNFKAFILTDHQIENIDDYDDHKFILNYSNSQNALTIDTKKDIFKTFYPNGNIASELLKQKDGYLYKKYFWDGNLFIEMQLNFELQPNGSYKKYHPNGNIRKIGHYFVSQSEGINGYEDYNYNEAGLWKTYYLNGKLFKEEFIKPYEDKLIYDNDVEIEVIESVISIQDDENQIKQPVETIIEEEKESKKTKLVKIYDINGQFINEFDSNNYDSDTISSIYNNQTSKFILKIIKQKETDLMDFETFESQVKRNDEDYKYYRFNKPFSGRVLKNGYYENYIIIEFKSGTLTKETKINHDQYTDYGLVRIEKNESNELETASNYLTDTTIFEHSRNKKVRYNFRYFETYTETKENGKSVYTSNYHIVPCVLNYIENKEELDDYYNSNIQFVPSLKLIKKTGDTQFTIGNLVDYKYINKMIDYGIGY